MNKALACSLVTERFAASPSLRCSTIGSQGCFSLDDSALFGLFQVSWTKNESPPVAIDVDDELYHLIECWKNYRKFMHIY